jgi:hypothetical protein
MVMMSLIADFERQRILPVAVLAVSSRHLLERAGAESVWF